MRQEPRSLNGTPGRIAADRISRVNSTLQNTARFFSATDEESCMQIANGRIKIYVCAYVNILAAFLEED